MPAGRPTAYKPEYSELGFKYCLLGATDAQMADFFDVSEQTINTWKTKHPEFLESIKKGKDEADAKVASSLYHRALGYEHDEDKIFNDSGKPLIVPTIKHYPPDTGAAIFWLKNRADWKDKQYRENSGETTKIVKLDPESAKAIASGIRATITED